jgi:hypothetical protein
MSASQKSALVDKQEAYIRIKKMLRSYILVWYYTFDKPWLWASQAASVARSSPLKSKAFREHFTMLKIDSELDDLGAAFRHLQQSLVGFEKKLGELKRGPIGRKLETVRKLTTVTPGMREDAVEKKITALKDTKDTFEKDVIKFVSNYQARFLDEGIIKSSRNHVFKKLESMQVTINKLLDNFGKTQYITTSEEIKSSFQPYFLKKIDMGIRRRMGSKYLLFETSKGELKEVEETIARLKDDYDLEQSTNSDGEVPEDGANESVLYAGIATLLYSSGVGLLTLASLAKDRVGDLWQKVVGTYRETTTIRGATAAYLDVTANNIHALASYISSYELK